MNENEDGKASALVHSPTFQKIEKILAMLFKSALIAIGLVAICTYIYFCPPVLTTFNGQTLLFPFPAGPEFEFDTVNSVKRDDVYFKNKIGDTLNGWFFQNPNKNAPVVFFSHGNGGNISNRVHLIKAIMDAGASVFIYDYRNYGKSTGSKSLSGVVEDADAAMDYLTKTRKVDPKNIVLYGESIGGGPTCYLLSRHAFKGVILDSTFTSLVRVAKKKVPFFQIYPDFFQANPAFDNRRTIMAQHPPLLIIHGGQDDLIPPSEAEDNFRDASQSKQLLLLPSSSHNDKSKDFVAYIDGMKKFFDSLHS